MSDDAGAIATSAAAVAAEARVSEGLKRLRTLLPLAERQAALPAAWRGLHRRILQSFARTGRAPVSAECATDARSLEQIAEALQGLADADLVVLDAGGRIVGAYPFTIEPTPHRLHLGHAEVNAMCAVDALAVAPVFDVECRLDSCCGVTGTLAIVRQRRAQVPQVHPPGLQVGVHWREPNACAAHSLCREMIFLRAADVALAWQAQMPNARSLYSVGEAALLGRRFFEQLV